MLWITPTQFIAQLRIERLPKSTKVACDLQWPHVGTQNFQNDWRATAANRGSGFKSIQPLNFSGGARRSANFICDGNGASTWHRKCGGRHALHEALILIGERVTHRGQASACLQLAGAHRSADNLKLYALHIGRVVRK